MKQRLKLADGQPKPPTSFDVARLAGVHRSAVSRTFSENGSVSPATRAKVQAAAEELGYRVNYIARGLHNQRSGMIGIVASHMDTSFRAEQVRAASRALLKHDHAPLLLGAESDEDLKARLSMMLSYNVDGLLVMSNNPPEDILDEYIRQGKSVVLVNRANPLAGADRVQIDNESAGTLAFNFLRECGAENLAIVCPKTKSHTTNGRINAFLDFARKHGTHVTVFEANGSDYSDGKDAADLVLAEMPLIDALFCPTDLLAFGVLDRLKHEHHVRVPDDLQVLGFDNVEQSGWDGYNLSTIGQNAAETANAAVQLMLSRMADPRKPLETLNVQLSPIHRETTKPPNLKGAVRNERFALRGLKQLGADIGIHD